MSSTSLRISQVDIKDSGLYQCVAENKAGTAQATSRLSVQLESELAEITFDVYITTC